MALLNAKLYVKRNGEAAVPCNLYSTTEEVGGEYVTVTASNIKAYAKLGGTSDAFCTQGRVKKGTNTYAILSQAKPPYTEMSWTTPGTHTWTCPKGVTRIKIAVCGGGGGACYIGEDDNDDHYYTAPTGGASSFGSLISAEGGRGGYVAMYVSANWTDKNRVFAGSHGGDGGSPNGNAGTLVYSWNANVSIQSTGGAGFSLSFDKINNQNDYGNGGYAKTYSSDKSYNYIGNAGGGSGGYNTGYVDVIAGETYSVTVGNAASNACPYWEGGARTDYPAKSGFVLIAFGGDI